MGENTHQHEAKACKSCGAGILWAQLLDERGMIVLRDNGTPKAIPVNFEPSATLGNIAVFDRNGSVVAKVYGKREAEARRAAGEKLRTSHFADCQFADQHRRRS